MSTVAPENIQLSKSIAGRAGSGRFPLLQRLLGFVWLGLLCNARDFFRVFVNSPFVFNTRYSAGLSGSGFVCPAFAAEPSGFRAYQVCSLAFSYSRLDYPKSGS